LDRLPRADRADLRTWSAARPSRDLLDPVGSAGLYVHDLQHGHVPQQVASRHDQARLCASDASAADHRAADPLRHGLLRRVPRLRHAAHVHGRVLYRGFALVPLPALPLRPPRRPVHHALAAAERLLTRSATAGTPAVAFSWGVA